MSDLLIERYPVYAEFIGGEIKSSGLAFDDYSRMSTRTHKLNANRQGPAPDWVFSSDKLRAVVVGCVEARALNGYEHYDRTGTDAERLVRAQQKLAQAKPKLEARIDELCKQYVAAKHAGDAMLTKHFAQKVEETDTQLRMIEDPAKYYVGVAYFYWRSGLGSVATGQALGLKPPHVRCLLWRMGKVAGELGYGPPKTITHRPGTKAAKKAAQSLAHRRKCQAQEARRLKHEAAVQAAMLTLKHRKDDSTILLAATKLASLHKRRKGLNVLRTA